MQAADMLAMVGGSGRGVDLAGVERGLLRPVVVDVNTIQGKPVLPRRLVKCVGHLEPGERERESQMLMLSLFTTGGLHSVVA
jgi:hypothetical protein